MSLLDLLKGKKRTPDPVPKDVRQKDRSDAPVICNEGEWKTDRNMLQLFLQCTLRSPQLTEQDTLLLDYLWEKRQSLDTYKHILEAIRLYCEASELDDESRGKYLPCVSNATAAAEDAIRAYTVETKENWRSVFWCNSSTDYAEEHRRYLYDDEELPYARETKFINDKTPIGSAGSCFAMEIRNLLIDSGYNYVETEKNEFASAGWGGLFNIPSIRQLVQKAFELTSTPKLLVGTVNLRNKENPDPRLFDPYRENGDVTYDQYVQNYESHLLAAREAFMACEVFILTLGMVEAWYLKSNGTVFSRVNTWTMSPALLDKRVIGYEENLSELQLTIDILKAHNPKLKILLSVSPVPLHATFQGDRQHVIAATCYAKSVLRAVAEEIVQRNESVYYFPSYEVVMYCTKNPFIDDNRHVSPQALRKVGLLFQKMFVEKGTKPLRLPPKE